MNIKTWFVENKLVAYLVILFLLGVAGLGYLTWNAWTEYESATDDYSSNAAKLTSLAQIKPFPNSSNLEKLGATLTKSQKNLESLRTSLAGFSIPPFGEIEKAKPQNQPQLFQDTLRAQVTAIKSLAETSSSTLPPSFYLGLDDYENRLPLPEQVPGLSKQLTALIWIAKTVVSQKGTIVAEFTRNIPTASLSTPPPAVGNSPPSAPETYETLTPLHLTMRCSQPALRNVINAIASAPYFMIIEDIKVQNSVVEPPRRTSLGKPGETSESPTGETASVERIPVIVGRESLNVSLKIRILDFPALQQSADSSN